MLRKKIVGFKKVGINTLKLQFDIAIVSKTSILYKLNKTQLNIANIVQMLKNN